MRRTPAIVVGAAALLVAGLALALKDGRMPLGVPGEWQWLRVRPGPINPFRLGLALAAVVAYAAFAALGLRALAGNAVGRLRESGWIVALAVVAAATQGVVQDGAADGYGLEKWILALENPGSSGYFTVAKTQMDDPSRFLADYPGWIARQDALHIGTHPPGLFVVARAVFDRMAGSPDLARRVVALAPTSTALMIRVSPGLSRSDAATLIAIGAMTLLACSLTVVPLYLLSRASGLPASAAWAAATLWPVLPSALMFQPTADTAFPLLSTSALALAAWAGQGGRLQGWLASLASGLILGVGMQFTLAFLPVGLIVAMLIVFSSQRSWPRRLGLIVATGVVFLAITLGVWAVTSANPFAIWWHNQANHARFYVENPRTYWAWLLDNPIETAVGLGLPTSAWIAVGLASPRSRPVPLVAWITLAVLALLTLGGRSLSEVARLWLPFFPALLVAAGAGFSRVGAGSKSLAATIALVGLQVLVMEAMFQVVYPI